MNFLVTYRCPNGHTFKRRTYTFCEAEAVANNALSKNCKDVSVTPLNEFARQLLNEIVLINDIRHIKEYRFTIIVK